MPRVISRPPFVAHSPLVVVAPELANNDETSSSAPSTSKAASQPPAKAPARVFALKRSSPLKYAAHIAPKPMPAKTKTSFAKMPQASKSQPTKTQQQLKEEQKRNTQNTNLFVPKSQGLLQSLQSEFSMKQFYFQQTLILDSNFHRKAASAKCTSNLSVRRRQTFLKKNYRQNPTRSFSFRLSMVRLFCFRALHQIRVSILAIDQIVAEVPNVDAANAATTSASSSMPNATLERQLQSLQEKYQKQAERAKTLRARNAQLTLQNSKLERELRELKAPATKKRTYKKRAPKAAAAAPNKPAQRASISKIRSSPTLPPAPPPSPEKSLWPAQNTPPSTSAILSTRTNDCEVIEIVDSMQQLDADSNFVITIDNGDIDWFAND